MSIRNLHKLRIKLDGLLYAIEERFSGYILIVCHNLQPTMAANYRSSWRKL